MEKSRNYLAVCLASILLVHPPLSGTEPGVLPISGPSAAAGLASDGPPAIEASIELPVPDGTREQSEAGEIFLTAGITAAALQDPVRTDSGTASDGFPEETPAALPPAQSRLVESAESLLGARELVVDGRRYSFDCSGTVMAIYAVAGIDLFPEYVKYGGNGVNRIYRIMEAADLLYDTKRPVPGDIIFWDDTYDRNGDGLVNDPLTHTGMVLSISDDGLISYVHFHYTKGIIIEYMNLEDPETHQITVDGKRVNVNSPLRMKSARTGGKDGWLAGQLYKVFGMGYRYEPPAVR